MVARLFGRRSLAVSGTLLALFVAGAVAVTGVPAQAQWHQVYRQTVIEYGVVPAPAYNTGNCHTVVYPDGATYSTCNEPGYTYYYTPRYYMYYYTPGYYGR
jgi:hypothetical protein